MGAAAAKMEYAPTVRMEYATTTGMELYPAHMGPPVSVVNILDILAI